jgi:hypothetical protein
MRCGRAGKINERQFQAWYGNNITGNWANGNSGVYNAPGSSYQIVDGSVVAADLNGFLPNYEFDQQLFRKTRCW